MKDIYAEILIWEIFSILFVQSEMELWPFKIIAVSDDKFVIASQL